VICDDHVLIRAGLRSMVEGIGGMDVVAEAGTGQEALAAVGQHRPELLMLDLSMPVMNGSEIIRRVKQRSPGTRVLVMTMHRALPRVQQVLAEGADGYALKSDPWDELVFAVRHVSGGYRYISPSLGCALADAADDDQAAELLDILTPRERQVLKLIGEGHRNSEIARLLSISVKTVENHRTRLMRKLDLHNAAAVVAYAINAGLVGE